MGKIFQKLKAYFVTEFSPEKLKWDRIVEDEKKARNCPKCDRFGFYIHLPTSIREYWWGMYRCKGCKTEYRPKFTKGNLFFLLMLALFYFQYFGTRGFSYRTYLSMAISFSFALGVNYIYSRISKSSASIISILLGSGWLMMLADIALAHHGEGVANGNPKDIAYLLGSTGGFTFAAGSLLGLLPGVQPTFEEFLDFLFSEEGDKQWQDRDGLGEPPPLPEGDYPDWVDPEYEKGQLEWWRSNLDDEKMRLDSYIKNRQNDPDFAERVEDMRRSIDYYNEKFNEQNSRLNEWGIKPGEQRPVNQWDPFKVSDLEREVQEETNRRQNWNESWEKFEKMRNGAEKRGHQLYGDSGRWDKAMDNIFNEDGEVDYDLLNKARDVFIRSIQADTDTMAPEHYHWTAEAALQTGKDAKNNILIRVGAGYLSGGTSEILFEPLDQLERMQEYVKYHDKGGSDWEAVTGGFKYGIKELAKDKLLWREGRTILFEEVEMPDGTLRKATGTDKALAWLGVGMKGKDWYDTTYKGDFWKTKAFGIGDKQVVPDIDQRSLDTDNLSKRWDDLQTSRSGGMDADGGSVKSSGIDTDGGTVKTTGGDADGGVPVGESGRSTATPSGSKIPADLSDDYNAFQRALANGDETGANRHATRMLSKDYEGFQQMARNGTIDSDTAKRAVSTHQQIVREGVADGLNRTKKMGNLLSEEVVKIDADGNMTIHKPVDHAWAPGSAMDDFDNIKRVPGDTDISPVVDRTACRGLGLDPDDVQTKTSGHMRDGINDAARKHLGDDVGDYCKKTKVKTFEPGSAEEYHAPYSHDNVKGHSIDSDGNVSNNKTTLGEEMWPGVDKDTQNALTNSKTGRSMVAADEHFQISKNIREHNDNISRLQNDPNLSKAELESKLTARNTETARDLSKHHGRMEDGANWKTDDVDTGRLQIDENTTSAEKLRNFNDTLETSKTYEKFYEDMRQSSRQATQTKLEDGGKIYDAQADRLRGSGVKVDQDNVIKHSPEAPANKKDYLSRMGVSEDEFNKAKQDKWEWQKEQLSQGKDPKIKGDELPAQSDKGYPGKADGQDWPTETKSVRDGKGKADEDWWPKDKEGKDLKDQPWPYGEEKEAQRWSQRDEAVGRQPREPAAVLGDKRPPELDKVIKKGSHIDNVDNEVRDAWKQAGAGTDPDSWNKFQGELDKKVKDGKLHSEDFDTWNKFMNEQSPSETPVGQDSGSGTGRPDSGTRVMANLGPDKPTPGPRVSGNNAITPESMDKPHTPAAGSDPAPTQRTASTPTSSEPETSSYETPKAQ
ncbi:MAG: hypothetical protein JRF25_01100, partial [Deltaproteobacteria bacterium]|nr:hypothetical protein [Deltaproteobacteria bacterium]